MFSFDFVWCKQSTLYSINWLHFESAFFFLMRILISYIYFHFIHSERHKHFFFKISSSTWIICSIGIATDKNAELQFKKMGWNRWYSHSIFFSKKYSAVFEKIYLIRWILTVGHLPFFIVYKVGSFYKNL